MPSQVLAPAPIETLRLPPDLDGSEGRNRAFSTVPQIAATNDIEAVKAFLARYTDTKTTFANYRKDAERLLLWAIFQHGKPLSSLTHEDFLLFQRFIGDPQPRAKWVNDGGKKHPRTDPRWRPFHGQLSLASQRQTMVTLNVLMSWLVQAGYLSGNPLALSRQRQRRAKPRITRYLDQDLWNEVKSFIESMPRETDRERIHYFRTRWLFTLLYIGGLRISEVAENTMGSFFCRRDKEGDERWWLEVLGKGDKERLVPATNELMVELNRYRRECGLPPFPSPNEETPLLLPIGKRRDALTRAAVHNIVKGIFEGTAARLRTRGPEYEGKASLVEQASAHWLRHTAGSHMADGSVDLRMVRDNLGHESLSTTSQYLHSDEDERHKETEEKHRLNW